MGRMTCEDPVSGFRWDTFLRDELGWETGERLNIAELAVDRISQHDPQGTALVFIAPGANREERYTFQELQEKTNRFAGMLGRIGVGKGDRVARLLPRCIENYVTFLGSWRAGAVDVPPVYDLRARGHRPPGQGLGRYSPGHGRRKP